MTLLEPANVPVAGIPAPAISGIILLVALCLFAYVMYRRLDLFKQLNSDPRFGLPGERIKLMTLYGFGQFRQPRYLSAGILHILLFAGFMILSLRSLTLIGRGFSPDFHLTLLGGSFGFHYEALKDYVVLIVLIVCIIAIIRRAVFKPARYEHPGKPGHEGEAYIILTMVAALMVTDMIYDGSGILGGQSNHGAALFPAANLAALLIGNAGEAALNGLHVGAYWVHILIFFSLLNYLPISKHFHVITAIPNIYLSNLNKGAIKPVKYGVTDWMELPECGTGRFGDFTWKHVLDFYSCADCGRCTDNCPANAVGRALSPKMISIKSRDYAYEHYPVFGKGPDRGDTKFTGSIITEKEIWACTTCGACERECPIFVEYIDKIVDMRRYLVDQGDLPQSIQKPMQQIKKKGNAYGVAKQKRAAWSKDLEDVSVKELKPGDAVDLLFFVDSCGSFDPRIQELSKSFARILSKAGEDFGILGQDETESGNEVRRLGEEGLYEQVRNKNLLAFESRCFKELVAYDPHAFNTIKNEYGVNFPVIHGSQLMARSLKAGKFQLSGDYVAGRTVTYHDPCYLGRHNQIYEDPRYLLGSIPGLNLREMPRSFSRSFCCGGGGLLLWYENEDETERMGERRVRMAQEVEAQIIVTACPFCLINLEDAVKTTGNDGKIEIIDLVELIDKSIR